MIRRPHRQCAGAGCVADGGMAAVGENHNISARIPGVASGGNAGTGGVTSDQTRCAAVVARGRGGESAEHEINVIRLRRPNAGLFYDGALAQYGEGISKDRQ